MVNNNFIDLSGKVAVVTGSSKGLGYAYAKALAKAGAKLVINSRHNQDLESIVQEIEKLGGRVLPIEADISNELQVIEMFKETFNHYGRVDILINNAASGVLNINPEDISLNQWNNLIGTNITGTFLCCREAGKIMIKQKSGKIINISSISAYVVNKDCIEVAYNVSKSGIIMLTKTLAVNWAKYNINVNAVVPGYYGTEINMRWFEKNPNICDEILSNIPLKKFGNIEELSYFIVTLCSDVTNYMTGSTIIIDGGYTCW